MYLSSTLSSLPQSLYNLLIIKFTYQQMIEKPNNIERVLKW